MIELRATALALFTEEFAESLPAILTALETLSRERTDRQAAREAYRLIHALKGGASMVGLAAFGYLLNVAEELLEAANQASATIDDETMAALGSSLPRFAQYMESLLAGRPVEATALDLARAFRLAGGDADAAVVSELLAIESSEIALLPADAAPAPPVADGPAAGEPAPAAAAAPEVVLDFDVVMTDEVAPELAEVFGEEAREHLDTIARLTSHLSNQAGDRNAVQELRRAVHTLKGAAGVVGYKGASKLAHRMEDLLDRLYDVAAAVSAREARALASSSDALHDLIMGTADAGALRASVVRLFGEFDALMATELAPPVAVTPPVERAVVERAGEGPAEAGHDVQRESERPAPVERRRAVADRRRDTQLLRVPLRRLNDLVRVVSELVINRSTFEQHHGSLIEQVDELKLSTARLRRVTHRLEADYEVRALGAARTSGGDGFDELEFDRYTEFHLLTRELAETASDIATIGARVAGTIGDFDSDLTRLGRLTREIQDKTMEFRMVPFGTLTSQLERAVRTTGDTCGKLVDFAMDGEHVALDKSLLEQMADPFLHLLRNAVDHGIERPERRVAAGKSERGLITVRAFHEGTDAIVEVQDDGGGLDVDRIRRTAIARGLVGDEAANAMAPDAVYGFIFEPGFSTASQVSEISGRGVGMDVVKSKVARVGGRVSITSQPGAGTTVSVRVPATISIARVLLVRVSGETFGLPLGAVEQIVRPKPNAIRSIGGDRIFTLEGRAYPLRALAELLGLPQSDTLPSTQPLLIANCAGRRIALAVDEIVNSRDAVVKTLGSHLRRVPSVWGATLLGDGTVVLILSAADLAGAAEAPVVVRPSARRVLPAGDAAPYTILIVDDSLSMRHVLSLAVKKAGWTAVPARDGLEALEVVDRGAPAPDLVLLDVEMPRMDGFEFLSAVRAQRGDSNLPIVMLTSRGGEKHRDKARALGATDYMVKPFQEEALLQNIRRLVQASREVGERVAS